MTRSYSGPSPSNGTARRDYEDGVKAFNAGDWAEAKQAFSRTEFADYIPPTGQPSVDYYRIRIDFEIRREGRLNAATRDELRRKLQKIRAKEAAELRAKKRKHSDQQ